VLVEPTSTATELSVTEPTALHRPFGQRTLRWPRFLAALSILALWCLGAAALPQDIVPSPVEVVKAMVNLIATGEAWFHLWRTLVRILVGFGVSAGIGIGIGLLMGLGRGLSEFLEVWLTVIITIPSLCWAIIALAWFGLRDSAAVFTIASITVPLIAVNFWSGVRQIDMSLIEMATVFQAPRTLIIKRVVLPQLVPHMIAAVRYGLPMAWKMAIIAEMLGLPDGVGYMLIYWFHLLNMVQVFAWMLLFTSVMLSVEYLVLKPFERRTSRWKPAVSY
jgi:NitT/TauT family transport system permease protein